MPRRSNPIPPERRELETRLVAALLESQTTRCSEVLAKALCSFTWDSDRELACILLGDLIKRQSPPGADEIAARVLPFCKRNARPICEECPVHERRASWRRGRDAD
jgi:hypothetical protein